MIAFSKMPQAYLLRLMAPSDARETFTKEYLDIIDFKVDDLVNGSYRVVYRDHGTCVFGMLYGPVEGRLVVSIEDETSKLDHQTGERSKLYKEGDIDEDAVTISKNQLFIWVAKDAKVIMPMERSLPRWVHETAAWWMMDSGIKYLCSLRQKEE